MRFWEFEIISDDGCADECIPLETPSPTSTSTPATSRTQLIDIQRSKYIEVALECVKETAPSQGQHNV